MRDSPLTPRMGFDLSGVPLQIIIFFTCAVANVQSGRILLKSYNLFQAFVYYVATALICQPNRTAGLRVLSL